MNGLKVRQPYIFGPTNEGLFTVRRRSSTGYGILDSVLFWTEDSVHMFSVFPK